MKENKIITYKHHLTLESMPLTVEQLILYVQSNEGLSADISINKLWRIYCDLRDNNKLEILNDVEFIHFQHYPEAEVKVIEKKPEFMDVDLDYMPNTKDLLIEYVYCQYEESADISNESLKRELMLLFRNNQLDELFSGEYLRSTERLMKDSENQ